MISKNSSHNAFLFTFKRLFKQCLPLALAPAAFFAVYDIFTMIVNIVDSGSPFLSVYGLELMGIYSDLIYQQVFYLLYIIFSCIFGLIAFNFLTNKRECNVYLSLGISKFKLFWSRYLGAGSALALGLVLAQIFDWMRLLIIGETFINAVNFKLWLFQTVYFLAAALCAYSVTVLSFVNSGNVVEGIIFTLIYGIFPIVFTSSSESAFGKLAFGSAYDTEAYEVSTKFTTKNWFLDIFGSITEDEMQNQLFQNGQLKEYQAPNPAGMLVCIGAFILIAVLASLFFKKRTSEISGTVFKSYNNYRILAVLLSVLAFCGLTDSQITSRYLLADVCIVIAVVIFIVISLIFTRKVSAKTAISLAASMAVFCIIAFVGYGKTVPEVKDIETVDVLFPNEQVTYLSSKYMMSSSEKAVAYTGSHDLNQYITLKTENDINWIRDIHQDIVNDGYRSKLDDNSADAYIVILYHLKDGSSVTRSYRYESAETYKKILGYMNTDKAKEYNECIFKANKEVDSNNTDCSVQGFMKGKLMGTFRYYCSMDTVDVYGYANGNLSAHKTVFVGFNDKNNLYLGSKEVDLTKDSSLVDALRKDLENQTVEQKYFHSSSDEIGVLSFVGNENMIAQAYEALRYYNENKGNDSWADEYDTLWDAAHFSTEEDWIEIYDEEIDDYNWVPNENYVYPINRETYIKNRDKAIEEYFKYGFPSDSTLTYELTDKAQFIITKDMVNTIKWLEDNGLYSGKAVSAKPVKAIGVKMEKAVKLNTYVYPTTFASNMMNDLGYTNEYTAADLEHYFCNSEEITDRATLDALLENSRLCAANTTDGFVVEFIYEDGTHVSKYVSKYNVSDELEAKFGYSGKAGSKRNNSVDSTEVQMTGSTSMQAVTSVG